MACQMPMQWAILGWPNLPKN
ncbi:uncharacterized protein G2W53_025570 [Senna tora]|uniref:Uncharacterized protein n=1 Tax=Senna tora TaxID=362788 RepID=A0A834WEB3_9FABA|nr:uncharacterized protein G2W53_025570 [Senna tora]